MELGAGAAPLTITNAGSYVLTANLSGRVTIAASGVSLDLNGFTVDGDGAAGAGVLVSGARTEISIRNGTVRDWAGHGVDAASALNSELRDVVVADCGGDGLRLGSGLVLRCDALRCGGRGIDAGRGSIVSASRARNVGGTGLRAGAHTITVESTVRHSGGHGIDAGSGSMVDRATSRENGGDGVRLGEGGLLTASTSYVNGGVGIRTTGPGALVHGSTVFGNQGVGMVGAFASMFAHNTIRLNDAGGIVVSNRSYVLHNTALVSSNGPALRMEGNEGRADGNHLAFSAFGLIAPGNNNLIVRNTAVGNATNYVVGARNFFDLDVNPLNGMPNSKPWASFDLP